jgi:diguanylate cyclase (GGDEF)-like protein/PAS domain S-box-containing protein
MVTDEGLLLRALLDSELDPRVVLSAVRDDGGQIVDFVYTEANAAACEYNRMPREAVVGTTLLALMPGIRNTELLRRYVAVVETGEPLVLNDFSYDQELRGGERSYFDLRAVRVGDGFSASWRDVSDRFRAARDIAVSEERYRLLAENMSDFVVITNAAGAIEWLSPSVERRLGWTPQELLGRSTADFIHPADLALLLDMRSRVEAGETASFRLRIGRSDGSYYWCAVIVHPVYDAAGTFVGRVSAFRDVQAEVEAVEALEESEDRFRLLAENTSAFVTLAGPDGVLQWASPSATTVLGWTQEGAIGRQTIEFLHPDDLPKLLDVRSRMTGEALSLCCRILLADGSYRWFDLAIKPVFDEVGALTGRVTAYQDAQARVEAEQALAASERTFRLLAENVSDVILHVRGSDVAWVSPSLREALGWLPSDWIGTEALAYVHPDDVEEATPNQILRSPQPIRVRLRVRDSLGDFHWIESVARAYLDDAGEPDGWISSFRVIDAMVRAEEELDRRARYDSLTGLLNRKEILQEIARVTSHLPRTGQQTAVLFCDIDRFKDINDTRGHAAGDEVLRVMAERASQSVRKDDVVARIGGDELLVLLTGVHSLDEATAIAEKIRARAEEPVRVDGLDLVASLSIGVTMSREGESTDDLVARADTAMYEAKERGRNRVVSM